jgi:H+/gluconate symporter-like permease
MSNEDSNEVEELDEIDSTNDKDPSAHIRENLGKIMIATGFLIGSVILDSSFKRIERAKNIQKSRQETQQETGRMLMQIGAAKALGISYAEYLDKVKNGEMKDVAEGEIIEIQ